MLIVLSPSKTLDYETPLPSFAHSEREPRLLAESEMLIGKLRTLSEKKLMDLMDISAKLAALNASRYRDFHTPFTPENARPAVYAFKGDVYDGLDVARFGEADLRRAEAHLRMLSGLYGLLRPLDLIQPYRLEMGIRLATRRGKTLYDFWGERITRLLNEDLDAQGDDVLVNLASQEYFAAVRPKVLKGRIVTPIFKERKGNTLSVIGLFAKKARGEMAAHILHENLRVPADMAGFTAMGYAYDANLSTETEMVFVR